MADEWQGQLSYVHALREAHPHLCHQASSTVLPELDTGLTLQNAATSERWDQISRALHPVRGRVISALPPDIHMAPDGWPDWEHPHVL